ncbi:hypothetical protein sscle_04g037690 [Sclerotinia sclerotiorum 1980 UF-70]|uniref:Uncharacterized protein n=1 Tax=Sclerotinia sclerotiorum (strain ATCC 18683 / 1980 / Ss-1) TaxID=665079 RepID=A0A1D9Q2B1_SCLS1|nr:hypothetical protein sscle_04g037690 [Sclerotinia sclerotiorum 1980 UF-70]
MPFSRTAWRFLTSRNTRPAPSIGNLSSQTLKKSKCIKLKIRVLVRKKCAVSCHCNLHGMKQGWTLRETLRAQSDHNLKNIQTIKKKLGGSSVTYRMRQNKKEPYKYLPLEPPQQQPPNPTVRHTNTGITITLDWLTTQDYQAILLNLFTAIST